MPSNTCDQRASLTYGPPGRSSVVDEGEEFASVREALAVVAERGDGADARPWIVTEDGAILTPSWIASALAERRAGVAPRARGWRGTSSRS